MGENIKNELDPIKVWTDYTSEKQTYLNIIADVTFFGREFGVLVLMDTRAKKVVYHRVIKTEKDFYYKLVLNILREKGYFPYKHRNVRGAYASLKYYMKYLFAFEEYAHLNIEKTTNRLEGLFKERKQKLSVHSGLTKKHKIMFIQDFLNKKSW